MDELWFKNAVVYALDVETFVDGNRDGTGDLPGLTRRLDYLRGLGVTCLWLLPFYPSPDGDNGYDVCDYYGVDPKFGDLGDFIAMLEAADELGIKVLVDLVAQHTSDQHPWFQAACSSRESPYRDFYVWSDDPAEHAPVEPVFPGHQQGTWTLHEPTGQYYRHRFYAFEPDLNHANPRVRDEIAKVMRFWLRLGVSGFRIDAAPYMVESAARDVGDGLRWIAELRRFITSINPHAVLLAETDITPPEYAEYFADGDAFQMLFNFYLNNYLWLALARAESEPISRAIEVLPKAPRCGQYAVWLRNHDELDLGRLTAEERQDVLDAFAPEESMRLFERGARRRPAPMLGGDTRALRMAHALLFSLPGAPVLRYGDEIGMGENLDLPERNPVRTPMQWCARLANAGFSPSQEGLVRQVILDGPFGAQNGVNVEEQAADPTSLLTEVTRLSQVRRACPEIGVGGVSVVESGHEAVLALRYDDEMSSVLTLVNLGPEDVTIRRAVLEGLECVGEVLVDAPYGDAAKDGPLALRGYGYRWLRGEPRFAS